MTDTFGDRHHLRRTDTGRAHTRREALDAATFDQDPDGCVAPLLVLALTIAAILGVLLG
ncbi:hypothetical protein [Streptomyces piniterrae]|uniref:hypothetical protein n=1 Tax=Streptomyces piniterrae TaxID=2571125 RepID=UPI00145DA979|nr:hypothetical protein [Streptomyces piniterrae]